MAESLRDLERSSIRSFVESHADKLTGRVLDLGCGTMPYKNVIEAAGGAYYGWDRVGNPGSVVTKDVGSDDYLDDESWDAILTTQTIQYVADPSKWLRVCQDCLYDNSGWIVITGPTNWPVLETADKWRFTQFGIEALLGQAGFSEIEVVERAGVGNLADKNDLWSIGWGAVGRA